MSKKNLAKRLIALVAIVAMFAAMTISASAATEPAFASTTLYSGNGTVTVSTTVTGLTKGDEVTYYAKNENSDDVYVNQYTASSATLTESYKADLEDVAGLDIKMAKVDEAFDNYAKINGENAYAFSIVMDGKVVCELDAAPAVDDVVETSVSAVNEGKAISSIKATYGEDTQEVKVFVVGGKIAIVNPFDFSTAEGIIGVDLSDAVYGYEYAEGGYGFDYVGVYCEAGYTEGDVEGNLIAVLYKATLPADAKEVGIEIRGENGEALADVEQLEALGVLGSAEPKFAVGMVKDGLNSIEYAPYYISADDEIHYGSLKTANFKVATAE